MAIIVDAPENCQAVTPNLLTVRAGVAHNAIDLIPLTHSSDFGRLPSLGAVKTESEGRR